MLLTPPRSELPIETLLARLRARRMALEQHEHTSVAQSPEELLAWLHPRLASQPWQALRPYLEYEAMRCLRLALRYRLGGEPVPAELLRQAWLAPQLPGLLERPGDARTVVADLEGWLVADYPFAAGLTKGYLDQGPGGVERQLAAGILSHSLETAREAVVSMVLHFLTDMRNLLAILRHWRWKLRSAPALLPGGGIDAALLLRVWASDDRSTLGRQAARLAGTGLIDLEPRAAERLLLIGLTTRLRRAGRDPLGIGIILDTVWRCRIATGNLALRKATGAEDGLLAGALL